MPSPKIFPRHLHLPLRAQGDGESVQDSLCRQQIRGTPGRVVKDKKRVGGTESDGATAGCTQLALLPPVGVRGLGPVYSQVI